MAGATANPPAGSKAGTGPAGSWNRGSQGRMFWDSPAPSSAEVEALRLRFPEVVVVRPEVLQTEADTWSAFAIVVRSLGRRVSVEALVREFRLRAGLKGEVSGFYLDDGFLLVRFEASEDRDKVLARPWVVAGQALAVEPWRLGFLPATGAIGSALVWVRLPQLPVEYWSEEALREVVQPAGALVSLDEWTAARKRLGFARVCLRIDLTRPLRPGVLVQGPEGPFWQRYIFENLDGVCLRCGRFHAGVPCRDGEGGTGADGLSSANLASAEGGVTAGSGGGQCLGPWLLAVRRWRPVPEVVAGSGKVASAPRRPGKEPCVGEASARSEHGMVAEGWTKPAKVARRGSPSRRTVSGGPSAEAAPGSGAFAPLLGVGEAEEERPLKGQPDGPRVLLGLDTGPKGAADGPGVITGLSRVSGLRGVVGRSADGPEVLMGQAAGPSGVVGRPVVGQTRASKAQGPGMKVGPAILKRSRASVSASTPPSSSGVAKGRADKGPHQDKTRKHRASTVGTEPAMAVDESGVFYFSAGEGGHGIHLPQASCPPDPAGLGSVVPTVSGAVAGGGSLDLSHEAAVSRVRRAIQVEGDGASAMDDSTTQSVLISQSVGGSSSDPPTYQPSP